MRSKLTMKHRHLNKKVSLFLTILAVVISYSLMIIQPYSADMNQNDQYVYTHAVVSQSYEYVGAQGGTTTASPKRMGLKYRMIVNLDGVYNGSYTFILTSSTNWSSQKFDISYINCYTDEYRTVLGTDLAQTVTFSGVSYFEVNVIIWTENGSLQYAPTPSFCKLTGVGFDEFSNLYQLTQSEIQTMINIKNSLYNIEAYTDQLETLLGGINTDMSYVRSSLNDIYNRAGYIVTQLTDIKNNTDTLVTNTTNTNTLLTDIKNLITGLNSSPTTSDITNIQNVTNDIDTINNIQDSYLQNRDNIVGLNKTALQYFQQNVDNGIVFNRSNTSLDTIRSIMSPTGYWTGFATVTNNMLLIVGFMVLLGVLLG